MDRMGRIGTANGGKQPRMNADGRRYGDGNGGNRVNGKANGLHHGEHREHGERRNLANGSDAEVKSIRCSPCAPW